MIPPAGMAMAAMTVMLWILWSDSVRRRRPSPILYAMRIALYLIVSGVIILNMVRFPNEFAGAARAVAILTVMVGIFGAGYFTRKLVTRS